MIAAPIPPSPAPPSPTLPPRRSRAFAAALAVLTLTTAAHTMWFARDARIPFWDQLRYYEMSSRGRDLLLGGEGQLLDLHPSHPPLYGLLGALPLLVDDAGGFPAARLVNLALVVLLGLGSYALAREFLDPTGAVLAMAFTLWAPLSFNFAHMLYTENLLAPWVVLSLLILRRGGELRRPWPAAGLGVMLGLGCLIKWTFPIFLLGPVAWAFVGHRSWKSLAALCAAALAVAAPWYITHLHGILEFFKQGVVGGFGELSGQSGLAGLVFYPREILITALGLPLSAAALAGAVVAWRRRRPDAIQLLAVVLVAGVVLTFALAKKPRHLIPAIPVFALFAAIGVQALRPRWLAATTGLLILTHVVLSSGHGAFGIPAWGPGIPLGTHRLGLLTTPSPPGPPEDAKWPYEQLMARAAEQAPGERPRRVMLSCNIVPFRCGGFLYHQMLQPAPLEFSTIPFTYPVGNEFHRPFPLDELGEVDLVIIKSGYCWVRYGSGHPAHLNACRLTEELLDPGSELSVYYPIVERVDLPDGSQAELRAREPSAATDLAEARFALCWDPRHAVAWRRFGATPPDDDPQLATRLAELGVIPADAVDAWGGAVEAWEPVLRRHPDREDLWLRAIAAGAERDGPLGAAARELHALREEYRTRPDSPKAALRLAERLTQLACPDAAMIWLRRALEADRAMASQVRAALVALGRAPPAGTPAELRQWLRAAEAATRR